MFRGQSHVLVFPDNITLEEINLKRRRDETKLYLHDSLENNEEFLKKLLIRKEIETYYGDDEYKSMLDLSELISEYIIETIDIPRCEFPTMSIASNDMIRKILGGQNG